MSDAWIVWWSALCVVAVFNAVLWVRSARRLDSRSGSLPADVYASRRMLLWLSAAYVLGCGFRSFLPMVDVPRMCLHDTWVSRIVVGRSVATVAELCFAAQWALLLNEAAAVSGRQLAKFAPYALMLLISAAEVFSWFAVLASNYLLHAVENSLWTLAAGLAAAAFAAMRPHVDRMSQRVFAGFIIGAVVYILFMVTVDVPMYLSRWHADLAAGHQDLTLAEGWGEILRRCIVVRDWAAWRQDVPWLSLYFSVAVWISIALARVPPLRAGVAAHRRVLAENMR
jgi:hypothetical protein